MGINPTTSYFEYSFGHTIAASGIGIPDCVNLIGAHGGAPRSDGGYQSMTAGSSAGNGCTLVGFNATPSGTANNFYFDQDVDITVILVTHETGDVRIWIAFLDQNTRMGNNDAFSGSANVIAMRLSRPGGLGGDTFWTGFCQDGVNSSTSTVGGTIGSGQYSLRIRKVSGTVYFSVDGGTEVSINTHVPTGSAAAGMSLEVWTTGGGVTHTMDVGRISCTIG